MPSRFLWSKLAAAKWEDAWIERLQCLGPGRLAIFSLPGSRRIRLEAYGLNSRDAARLREAFGGQVRKMRALAAPRLADEPAPLLIRDRLVVVRSPGAAKAAARLHPGRPLLIIPAAMAFGTGDHATTAACLRLVSDFAAARAGLRWEALDLGAGTGILALAARRLGAARCDAWDNDPACIRAIRGNARLNGLRDVPAARVDVTTWTPGRLGRLGPIGRLGRLGPIGRQWDLITANLFSEMLIKISATIAAALKPDGRLILSGMLAPQAGETLAAFEGKGVKFQRIVRKGKWVTALGGW